MPAIAPRPPAGPRRRTRCPALGTRLNATKFPHPAGFPTGPAAPWDCRHVPCPRFVLDVAASGSRAIPPPLHERRGGHPGSSWCRGRPVGAIPRSRGQITATTRPARALSALDLSDSFALAADITLRHIQPRAAVIINAPYRAGLVFQVFIRPCPRDTTPSARRMGANFAASYRARRIPAPVLSGVSLIQPGCRGGPVDRHGALTLRRAAPRRRALHPVPSSVATSPSITLPSARPAPLSIATRRPETST